MAFSSKPPEASNEAFRKSRRVMDRSMPIAWSAREFSPPRRDRLDSFPLLNVFLGNSDSSAPSAAGSVQHYTDLPMEPMERTGWQPSRLCYHLLFSFRICRAESKIPAGERRNGI
jgi:hypothetical protein